MEMTIGTVSYFYRWLDEYDQNKPTLLCLHGFTGSHQSFSFLKGQQLGVNILLVDLLGHGQTTVYTHPYRYQIESQVRDLVAIIDFLKLEKIYLLGYSMGGRLGIAFAASYPERLLGLILESSSPGLRTERERLMRRAGDRKLSLKLMDQGIEAFVDFWEDLLLFTSQKGLDDQIQKQVRQERLSQQPYGLICSLMYMGTGQQPSYWEGLVDWDRFSVSLMVGERDAKFVGLGKEMADLIPESQLVIFEEAGHCVHLEKPKQFLESLQKYFDREGGQR